MADLFASFFASMLMTRTSNTLETTAPGAQVSVARFGHYCHAMDARLSDIRVAQGHTPNSQTAFDFVAPMAPQRW